MSELTCLWKNCKNVVLMDGHCSRHLKQKCAICFEMVPSTNSSKHKRLNCGHAFHFDCILQWFLESDICPICRKKQNESVIQFKNKVEKNLRDKYRDAIRSLENENRSLRKMLNEKKITS